MAVAHPHTRPHQSYPYGPDGPRLPWGRIALAVGILAVIVAAVSIASCSREPSLPQGEQTLTGTLRPAELSRTRLGTHTFEQDGLVRYFAESTVLNLRSFENGEVTIKGEIKPNTDRQSLPVIVITAAAAKDPHLRTWKVPSLHLSLDAPEDWQGRNFSTGAIFRIRGISEPVLTIGRTRLKTLPEEGEALLLGGTFAARHVGQRGQGEERVYVQRDADIFQLVFHPPLDVPYVGDYFDRIVRTVAFQDKTTSTGTTVPVTPSSASSVAPGAPCGGAAGFLCPAGQYCEITDQENNIGVCKTIR